MHATEECNGLTSTGSSFVESCSILLSFDDSEERDTRDKGQRSSVVMTSLCTGSAIVKQPVNTNIKSEQGFKLYLYLSHSINFVTMMAYLGCKIFFLLQYC